MSRARSRGSLPRRVRSPAALVPFVISLSHWKLLLRPCPVTTLPTQGSSLSPRRRAAGRARLPRDRPPAVATARGNRPPQPHSFASAASDDPRQRPARTPSASTAHDPASISRPSTAMAVAVAGTDTDSRSAGRGLLLPAAPLAAARARTLSCCGQCGCGVSTAVVLPGRASWSPGGHPRLRGHVCRDGPSSAPPFQHEEEGRRGRWRRWPCRSHLSLWSGWWSPPPCMSCRRKMREMRRKRGGNEQHHPVAGYTFGHNDNEQ